MSDHRAEHVAGDEYREPDRDGPIEPVIDEEHALTDAEMERVPELVSLRAPAIYAVVKEEGEAELARPTAALFWSGLVAGVSMGFSVLALSAIRRFLPDVDWAPLIASFGYAFGFLIVILGRQQLFTESTITAVVPLASRFSLGTLGHTARVWGTVLLANWIGCALIAAGFVFAAVVPKEIAVEIVDFSKHLMDLSPLTAFVHGIGAGFLIAALVWMMPMAEASKALMIILVTWLIAVAGFTHAIAGMVEIMVLVFEGEVGAWRGVVEIALPTLLGNIAGGTFLFAGLAYAQVHQELGHGDG